MSHAINIAIDGPSGVGKSTISDRLAAKLHMHHLDTGAMYRCVALYLKENHIDLNNEKQLQKALGSIEIEFENDRVLLNKKDVTKAIRMNDISMYTSVVSAIAPVRTRLVSLQQKIAKDKGYIVDGRDICSVVLPDADVKIYMDASPKARADHRYSEYVSKGIDADYDTIYKDILARDKQDMERTISPLVKAEDAVVVDTSNLSIDEVVDTIIQLIP